MIAAALLVPLLGGFAAYAFPRRAAHAVTGYGIAVSLVTLALTVLSAGSPDESVRWLSRPFTASFHLANDGVGFWLAALLALVTPCALLATRAPRRRNFVALMLMLEGAMLGLFFSRDVLLFALFWDLMLVPVFLLMVGWGSHAASAWRYLIYNFAGGLALLLATAALGAVWGSTDILGAHAAAAYPGAFARSAPWLFAGFAFAFLVKTPVWPFHTWMPDTYADLPPPAVAVVSAVQSKAGLYGFIVVTGALFAPQMHAAAPLMFAVGLIALIYGAVVALVQTDAKRVVAYSSLSHLGLIVLAVFSFNDVALRGAIVYLIAHGLFSAALFIVLGFVEEREETRSLARLGGLGTRNPRLAGAFVIAALAALGLPGLAGFAGELLILTGLFQAGDVWPAAIALVAIVLAAAYMLRLFAASMHGPEIADLPERPDLRWSEGLALAPLVLALVLLGVNPRPVAQSAPSISHPAVMAIR